jgi:hypothetical protein
MRERERGEGWRPERLGWQPDGDLARNPKELQFLKAACFC